MATKIKRGTKTGRRIPDGKRMTFVGGKAKMDDGSLPLKTTEVENKE